MRRILLIAMAGPALIAAAVLVIFALAGCLVVLAQATH